jgi:hypothetical protein
VRVLSPIPATARQQHALGTSHFLSPVRRSARLVPQQKLLAMMMQVCVLVVVLIDHWDGTILHIVCWSLWLIFSLRRHLLPH